jgi:hypothetical protein
MAWSETYHIPFKSTPYEFHLHGFCDLQIGSESTSLSAIKTRIHEIVSDPIDSGIIIPGDIEDEDRPSTRSIRKSAFAERPEVPQRDAQKHMRWLDDEVIPLLLKLQKTKYGIMGILAGHHWTQLSPALNSVQYMCQELTRLSGRRVPYLGEMMSYLDLRFETSTNKTIKKIGLIVHGEGGGQTKGASIQKIERLAQGFEGDFFIRGHDCQLLATKTDKLYPKESKNERNEPEMLSRTIAYLNLGAATRGYDMNLNAPSYIEQKLLRPSTLGWGYIRFILRHAYKWEDSNQSVKCFLRVDI